MKSKRFRLLAMVSPKLYDSKFISVELSNTKVANAESFNCLVDNIRIIGAFLSVWNLFC